MPVVCAIHGLCLAGGFELALTCDYLVAARSSRLGAVEATIGLHPLMGAVQRIAQRAGALRAKEMAMLGRRYDADTLAGWRHRCDSGIAGERGFAAEPRHPSGLPDNFGSGQLSAAENRQQRRSRYLHPRTDAPFQYLHLRGESDDVGQLLASQLGHQPRLGGQPATQRLLGFRPMQRPRFWRRRRFEFMHPP